MNITKVKAELEQKYPGGHIKENTDPKTGEVIEIISEIDRKLVNSEHDVAVVVADRSTEHLHKKTTEEYEVIEGSLRVFLNGKPHDLQAGEKIMIKPGTKHRVEGKETWFYCYSDPDWTIDDLYLVEP